MGGGVSVIELVHGDLCRQVVGVFYDVFRELGAGFLERAYQRALEIALRERGLSVEREVPATVYFRGHSIGDYRLDLVVANALVVECKTAERIVVSH